MVDTTGHSTFAKDRGPSTATSQARPDPPPTIVSGAGALEILRSRTYVQRQVNRGRPPPDYEEAPMSKQRSIPVIRSWRPVGPSLSAAALRTPHRHCSVAPPTVPAAGVPAAPGPPLSCRGGPLPYRGGDGRPVPRRPLRYWQAAGQVRTTGRWSSIGAAVLAVTALVLASAPADAACDAGDRISHRDSMCLRASWDNEGLPGFTKSYFSVQNMCPEYGTLVAKVDLADAMDRTLHLAGSDERRGSTFYRIRWISCCSDLSANCELGQADMDAGCLGTFLRESSAARTCVNATGSSSVSGGDRKCTIFADCELMTRPVYTRSGIILPMSDVDDIENCNGRLTRGPCWYGRAARSVEGSPALSVVDAWVREAPGASLAFSVMLDQAASGPVTADYATSDGTAEAGADYVAANGTLSFAAGETARTVFVPVLEDGPDEGEEALTLRLSNASGARIADPMATGTIANSDPLPKARLTGFGRAVASGLVDRLGTHLTVASREPHATLGGQRIGQRPWGPAGSADNGARSRKGIAASLDSFREEDAARSGTRTMNGLDLLSGTSFLFAAGDAAGPGGRWSGWGQAATLRFDSVEGPGGDGLIGLFGVDYERGSLLAGVALSRGAGAGGWTEGEPYGMDAALTGVHPYLRLALTDRFSVWGAVGYGTGEMTVTDGGGDGPSPGWRTGIGMSILALGAGGALLEPEEAGGLALSARSDAYLVRIESGAVSAPRAGNAATAKAEASRVRLVLDGSRRFAIGPGRALTPSFEAGLRHDGGDGASGTGAELGAALRYEVSGLALAVRLLGCAGECGGHRRWHASLFMHRDTGAGNGGPGPSLSSSWDVTWGGRARPEHWIGIRFDLPFGVGGRGLGR